MRAWILAVAVVVAGFAGSPAAAAEPDLAALVAECAPCHGVDGIARDAEVPHLAGQNLLYLANQLRAFHAGTRRHHEMRVMTRHLSEPEIEALAEYYAGLPR